LESNKYEVVERILEKKAFQNKRGAFKKYFAVVEDEKRSFNL